MATKKGQKTNQKPEDLSGPQLVNLYNSLTGKKIKRFSDRKTALRRVNEALDANTKKATTPTKKGKSKPRVGFNFPKQNAQRSMRDGTLRAQVADALRGGATFEKACEVVKAFDLDRGVNPANVESRTYGAIRLLHFYVGYGLQERDGKIFLVE